MTTATLSPYSALRLEQIGEALFDLEQIFFDPDVFGDATVGNYAESLSSEFIGHYSDEEITSRLAKMATADAAADPRAARRHLTFVRRKLAQRFALTPTTSEPLVPDADAKRLATRSPAVKTLVAARHTRPASPQAPVVGIGATSVQPALVAGVS